MAAIFVDESKINSTKDVVVLANRKRTLGVRKHWTGGQLKTHNILKLQKGILPNMRLNNRKFT